jgi:Skp family chaperone for outer membrane proteins
MRLWVCVFGCLATAAAALPAGAGEDGQRLAVVNVSLVFENYKKVPDIQRRIDELSKGQKADLERRAEELAKRNNELEQFASNAQSSEAVFDAVQKLRRDQFLYEHDLNRLNADIQKNYRKEMREVLTDIRASICAVAEKGRFDLVLRSPDTDDPDTVENKTGAPPHPAAGDNQTFLALHAPKTAGEVVERFNRNPVLFGARTVDVTQEVLAKLNADYLKRAGTSGVQ